jgi:MazG family protein
VEDEVADLKSLVNIVARLRGPDGCPWDQAQDLRTMRPYLLEETYEVLDAMDGNAEEGVSGEIGDLLFVVLLIARIAEDAGEGSLDAAVDSIVKKMIDRHPHVFGDGPDSPDPGGIGAWEARKQRNGRSRLDGVPRTLPALLRAHRQGEKASAVGFDWADPAGVLDKVREELAELEEALAGQEPDAIAHEFGDLLLSMANLGRHIAVPPEAALRTANDRFSTRFGRMEELAVERGLDLGPETDPDVLDALWERAKSSLDGER